MRIFQLDLARQPQPVAFIEKVIDFIADSSYTHILLYLEGRIRTSSFHLLPEDVSYSPDEMRHLVKYAADRSIEVIPAVSMLGHAELFLQCPELDELSELRNGAMGRFSAARHMFCPTNPKALQFIRNYLAEVAEIFPSEYIHAGFDECWDVGYCPECRSRLAKEGQSGIFGAYLMACHEFITGTLKRKMMMWDDMLELYRDLLFTIPRDIILCSWHYERTLEQPRGHIGGPRRDIFAEYEQLGFSYLFAPATISWRNVENFTEYVTGNGYHPLGAFLTSWEVGTPLWLPVIAAAGSLWSTGQADPMAEIRKLAPGCSQSEAILIRMAMEDAKALWLPLSPEAYLKGELSDSEYMARLHLQADLLVLGEPRQGLLEEATSQVLNIYQLYFNLRSLICRWYGLSARADSEEDLREALKEQLEIFKVLKKRELALGEKQGYNPAVIRKLAVSNPIGEMLEKLLEKPRPAGKNFLFLRIPNTPDHNFHGIVSLKCRGELESRVIWKGGCSQNIIPDQFKQFIPVEISGIPEEITVETDGHVGTSLSYVRLITETGVYEPAAVTGIIGRALSPESLLGDGNDSCLLGEGEQPARRKFLNRDQRGQRSGVILSLQKVKD